MPMLSTTLKIARYGGEMWLSVAAWTFVAQVLQTRRCRTGYYGPVVQESYEQVLKQRGRRKIVAYDARLCLLTPWATVTRLYREGAWVRKQAGDEPVPAREYVPRPLRPF